jgi:hypothetical protein
MPCAANAIPLDLLTYVVTQDDLNARGARYYVIEGREKVAYFMPDARGYRAASIPLDIPLCQGCDRPMGKRPCPHCTGKPVADVAAVQMPREVGV